jgi:adenosylhomocysteine nucleosidase/futalosine hydrolase
VHRGSESLGSDIENMEGAALFAAAESLGLRVAEIRAISNRVGEPFAEWRVEEALEALAEVLSNIEKEL